MRNFRLVFWYDKSGSVLWQTDYKNRIKIVYLLLGSFKNLGFPSSHLKIIHESSKYIFAQLTDFLPRGVFDRLVEKYDGNKYLISFSCRNQMLYMVFGQLTVRDSLGDLMLSLETHRPKYYYIGFGTTVTRRNLGKANERRYTDFRRLYNVNSHGSFSVARAKENLQFKRVYSRKADKITGAISNQIGSLVVYKSKKRISS